MFFFLISPFLKIFGNVRPVVNPVTVSSRTKNYGERAFVVVAPTLWNAVPIHIRNSPTAVKFKAQLKTYLFKTAFLV